MIGKYITVTTMGDPFKAFIPDRLPRSASPHSLEIKEKIEAVETALAKLNVANELIKRKYLRPQLHFQPSGLSLHTCKRPRFFPKGSSKSINTVNWPFTIE